MVRIADDVPGAPASDNAPWTYQRLAGAGLLIVLAAGAVYLAARQIDPSAMWNWLFAEGSATRLRWLIAVLPGGIIVNHLVYLLSSRRKQFREALGPMEEKDILRLEGLYFGFGSLTARYLVPAVLVTVLTATAIAALTNPQHYLGWLYVPPATAATGTAPAVGTVSAVGAVPAEVAGQWPTNPWAVNVLRGAVLGFMGAYLFMLLLLTDRARQRDVTTGIATWAAAMPVLGPMMGGVAALLLAAGAAPAEASFTRDAVFFVSGMLPRQFATFVQSGVRRMFQSGAATVLRTLPLTMIRGVGPDVEARLEEEGIHDVSALAYASPHRLVRATTYAPKQIADWIDEALLIATLPVHWDALEKVGVTGAMDLAWYQTRPASIKALADEIKMSEPLLTDTVARLSQDAQVLDLYTLYWDRTAMRHPLAQTDTPPLATLVAGDGGGTAVAYRFRAGIEKDARERMVSEVRSLDGVHRVAVTGDDIVFIVDPSHLEAVEIVLRGKGEIEPGMMNATSTAS